jgi:hypothetical protein
MTRISVQLCVSVRGAFAPLRRARMRAYPQGKHACAYGAPPLCAARFLDLSGLRVIGVGGR